MFEARQRQAVQEAQNAACVAPANGPRCMTPCLSVLAPLQAHGSRLSWRRRLWWRVFLEHVRRLGSWSEEVDSAEASEEEQAAAWRRMEGRQGFMGDGG